MLLEQQLGEVVVDAGAGTGDEGGFTGEGEGWHGLFWKGKERKLETTDVGGSYY